MPPSDAGDIDEDDAVIAAFDQIRAGRNRMLLILAPRKPERFDGVAEKLRRSGIPFVRRSALAALDLPGVLLLDSIGELAALFERADVVFMGGTLARRGGHNILEPAYFGKPVIVGPHMENFAAIAEAFYKSEALARIEDPRDLSNAVSQLLDDPARRALLGSRARELAASKRGVAALLAKEIWRARALGIPNPLRTLAARMALTPLSWLWQVGHRVNMKRGLAARRALETPVISIGAVAMGGAGKTPMVAHLAARLQKAGRNPAILTRGYQSGSAQRTLVVPRGGKAPRNLTGDEAQIVIRAGDAHVGIGGDRFEAGRRMEQELKPDVFLLDDGFQHVRLARSEDVVLIDALDPLGGGVFPLGRLREPMKSLARATMIVVTRVEPGQDIAGIERLLRQYNAQAPVFRSRVVPKRWIDLERGTAQDLSNPGFRRAAAFCGLGAPRSFWRTLEQLGVKIAFRATFPDHHRYRPAELRRLVEQATGAGVDALLTTEKDAANLPDGAAEMLAPHRLLWLEIDIEIEGEDEFLRRILL